MGKSAVEKILSRVMGRGVEAGEIIFPVAELVTVHDWYAANAAKTLHEYGVARLYDPERVAIFTDHEPVATSPHAALRQQTVREAARRLAVRQFFDVGRGGLGHIFGIEAGLARPGMFAAGYDTHITSYGAIGCFAVAVVTEIPELLACGSVWLRVPETVRIQLSGKLQPGVSIRDAAQHLIGTTDPELFDDAVIEFAGPAMAELGVDARLTLVNTPMELGARTGFVEPDAVVLDYCRARGIDTENACSSDPDFKLRATREIDLSSVEPQVACPPRPDNVRSVSQVAGTPVDHAYIGSCASGMLDDLRLAAALLAGRQVHPGVRLLVTPATQEIAQRAAEEGILRIFIESGAIVTAPGCGVCAGGRIGPVASGETSIGTGTRNDYGRLGTDDAELFLASPATVAASCITGTITDPRDFIGQGS
jgi:3-isopropylmalate/(R)-2-methylmalate dehydratase large subunit